MYTVTQSVAFCYGHRLLHYEGKCRHLHGHNARAVITLEGNELDQRGMLYDCRCSRPPASASTSWKPIPPPRTSPA